MALFILLVIFTILNKSQGYFLTMKTEGDVKVLNEGENVMLDCDYHADHYNLFDYPVMWIKTQRNEENKINIMGNINEPYVTAKRFTVAFSDIRPTYGLTLNIKKVTLEDSGNYTCEVRGPQSIVLGYVTHYVFVRAPIQSMKIVLENSTGLLSYSHQDGQQILSVTEGEACSLRCIAHGGYPPPKLEIHIGSRDISADFQFENTAKMTGKSGLRVMHYVSQRFTQSFIARAEDDGDRLKCIATVPGLIANMTYVRLAVEYTPKITCSDSRAFVGDTNVFLRCDVRSKPRAFAVFWVIDHNGTTLSDGEVINEYWSLNRDRGETQPDMLESRLYLRKARKESFHRYTLIAENKVGVNTWEVNLYEKRKTTAKQPLSHSSKTNKNTVVRNPQGGGTQNEGHVGYVLDPDSSASVARFHGYLLITGWAVLAGVAA